MFTNLKHLTLKENLVRDFVNLESVEFPYLNKLESLSVTGFTELAKGFKHFFEVLCQQNIKTLTEFEFISCSLSLVLQMI